MQRVALQILMFVQSACWVGMLNAAEPLPTDLDTTDRPVIAIIIDDLGNQKRAGERAVALPGPVTCSIIPNTAYSTYLAERANSAGKEVMLHLPMQAMAQDQKISPSAINIDTDQAGLQRILDADLQDVPNAAGINNHMGSLITRHPGHMEWLMEDLYQRGGLFFVDSYTTESSVALEMALAKGVPAARRDVFLDNDDSKNIEREFERLKRKAQKNGFAIGIGHPYPATLEFLEAALPQLAAEGYELVPVRMLIDLQNETTDPATRLGALDHPGAVKHE